jgi:hypothetical protein
VTNDPSALDNSYDTIFFAETGDPSEVADLLNERTHALVNDGWLRTSPVTAVLPRQEHEFAVKILLTAEFFRLRSFAALKATEREVWKQEYREVLRREVEDEVLASVRSGLGRVIPELVSFALNEGTGPDVASLELIAHHENGEEADIFYVTSEGETGKIAQRTCTEDGCSYCVPDYEHLSTTGYEQDGQGYDDTEPVCECDEGALLEAQVGCVPPAVNVNVNIYPVPGYETDWDKLARELADITRPAK